MGEKTTKWQISDVHSLPKLLHNKNTPQKADLDLRQESTRHVRVLVFFI